jgi:uncharacterized protein YggU (UPF0235/DUF167 family)
MVRITVRVRPGSARPGVGGGHDGALVVRVSARAVDGQATAAALVAVAEAFGVPRRSVTLVSGAASRTKVIDVPGADPDLLDRLLAQLGGGRERGSGGSPHQSRRNVPARSQAPASGPSRCCSASRMSSVIMASTAARTSAGVAAAGDR